MLQTGSKWGLFALACLLMCFMATSAQAEESLSPTIFHRLYEGVFGKQIAMAVDLPECLIELKGGIEKVEETLNNGIKEGKKWAILVTAAGDKTSVATMQHYYEAVNLACSPASKTKKEAQIPAGAFEDDTSEQEYTEDASDFDFSEWKFAELGFIDEPDLIWRWWIWKVPTVVFVSAPTQDQVPFDMRFLKVAFSPLTPEGFLAAVGTGGWKNLEVWQSSLAPGGSLEMIPHYLGRGFGVTYRIFDPIPTWLLTILASVFGSSLISMLHSGGGSAQSTP